MNASGRYMFVAAICFVIVMFGSRFVTLRFGQVFPEQSATDRSTIAALNVQVAEQQKQLQEMEATNARLSSLQADVARLREQVANVKTEPPIVEYVKVPVKSSLAQPPSAEPEQPASGANIVRRGDTMEKVRRVFGKPESVHTFSAEWEQWSYEFPKSIDFKGGRVDAWVEMDIEP